ncbi:DNA mismatch repair endonuclease MutL [Ruminococcus flavefaciens]|uniref:DNA mismatch repair endonuclease MutL n=1 Tax=Ruminococcus flavefaciens TaxID=1265 RepID=UPI0026ED0010|nr:DNA mismatch repair endonuclease MutL [Ruminococcus flavefaciens]MDD7515963.1 DNA mismatch repair endonuclease MutL [Ruminococcus flavefaciens]MDY5691662.1 DNA mismatch repair endonuclease MutL [Ruminococcus flavefaciens]
MPPINVLSKEISELIAAGEVIERPSSVIKELVENSIDSGATHITVEIKNGGTTYMRVTDDGCGMSFDDVPKAFLRHATSKIREKEDLDNILTLGFRGEALASVAAVARVEIMTKQKEELYGALYTIEGSVEKSHEQSGCPDGTTVIIRDLFYNVPARRKFMKKDVTEANAVSNILQKITMSHPDIAFRFIRDNRTEFNSSGDGELFSAVYAVYGRDFARDLIPVDYEYEGVHVGGYVIKPLYSKNNRAFQNFFVNGRYVRSRLCSAALENAYTNMIMTGKFPACVLLIDLPPHNMDVNIHPTKAEVRFTNEKSVSDAVYFAVKNAMMKDGLIYEFELKPHADWTKAAPEQEEMKQQEFLFTPVDKIEETEQKLAEATAPVNTPPQPVRREYAEEPYTADIKPSTAYDEHKQFTAPVYEKPVQSAPVYEEPTPAPTVSESKPEPVPVKEPEPPAPVEGFSYITQQAFTAVQPAPAQPAAEEKEESVWTEKPKIRVIGEAFGLYVIAELGDDTMIMIDKHAAHERIIFERLKSRNCRQYSQQLLTGVRVLLTGDEFSALETNQELLADLGFTFDFSEKPCAVATAVPTFIMELDMEDIISEIANNLRMYSHDPQSHMLDDMLHTVACKSAIKGNDKNSIEELQSLAEQVYFDERIRHCPHGRPVIFTMTKSNISHQFKRT